MASALRSSRRFAAQRATRGFGRSSATTGARPARRSRRTSARATISVTFEPCSTCARRSCRRLSFRRGWRLRSWIGRAPDELVESFAVARDAMNDAPAPAGVEGWTTTVEEVRRIEQTAAARGREIRVTVALDDHDEIGAFTDLRATPGETSGSDGRHRSHRAGPRARTRARRETGVAAASCAPSGRRSKRSRR